MTTLPQPLSLLTTLLTSLTALRASSLPGYRGPSPALAMRPGQRAWVPWLEPSGGGGTLALCHYAGTEGSQPRFLSADGEATRRVPSAFVRPIEPARALLMGGPVLAPHLGGSSYGRISAMALETVRVDFVQALGVETRQYHRNHVIPLRGTHHFGAPVAYLDKSIWRWGQWIGTGRRSQWVLARDGTPREVPAAAVRPLSQERLLPGDSAVALDGEVMEVARVIRLLDDGLSYVLRFESSDEVAIRDYALVGAPLSRHQ